MLIVRRFRAKSPRSAISTAADWILLALVWITGVTGFALELALYLPSAPAWGYWVFLFHVAVAMELVILAPVHEAGPRGLSTAGAVLPGSWGEHQGRR